MSKRMIHAVDAQGRVIDESAPFTKADYERVLRFANGSTLTFKPGDAGDQLAGPTYEYLLIDDEGEGEPC